MIALPDFLLARIAEREAVARAAVAEAAWEHGDTWGDYVANAGQYASPHSDFAAHTDWPSAVLAECEAKRRIVALESCERAKRDAPEHRRAWEDDRVTISFWESGVLRTLTEEARDSFLAEWYETAPPGPVLRFLALPYLDHPDWREEWRP